MPVNNLKPFGNEDEIDVKQKSLYARLKRLLSSGAVVRNVGGKKLKVKDTSQLGYATDRNSLRDRFNRVRSTAYNAYTRDFALSYQAARIDLFRDYDCVGPDTIIPLPDGSRPTISELAEKYKDKPQERFYVFSYDHETDSIKLGKAYHPRKKKGKRIGYKVIFDNGQYVVGSLKHPFMMRDGSYKMIYELRVGDSVMPFYQKDYNCKYNKYKKLYNFSKGWQSEHVVVAEQFDRSLNDNEVVHHKNFNGYDNSPDNLQIMTKDEHIQFHSNYSKNILWGDENYENQLNKLKSHPNYINRKFHHWDGERVGENNPFFGKTHSEKSNKTRSETLKEVFKDRNQTEERNPKYRGDITFSNVKEKALEFYKENSKINLWDFIKHIRCDHSTLQNRLKKEGHDWKSFKQEVESTLNHKIVSIESIGEVDVYDVTVEKYKNFSTDSCFVSNTMDMDPILASALDIYADECVTKNEMGKILTVHTEDDNIKEVLHNLHYDILNIEFNLWSWTRNLCKYGDFYLRTYISPEYGVYQIEPVSAYNVERIENSDPMNKNYVKFQIRPTDTSAVETLESFELAHFRLISDSNFLPYGKSMIESARRIWKQLSLMEDAMLIHRIMRAPEKRIFKMDVGNIPPGEVDAYMEKVISKMKKVPYLDPQTGDYNLRFNLQNMVEDFYLPVRGSDSGSSIDTLGGMEFTGIEDIEYLRNKMMAALKIPKAFLGYEDELSGKATLASEDIRFAKTIQRIQGIIVSELEKISILHLYSQGYRDEKLVNFRLELTNPSTIFEKEKIELWGNKVDVASNMMEAKLFSKSWIYKNIFNLSDDDTDEIAKAVIEDAIQAWRIKQIEEDGNDPAKPFNKINPEGGPGGEPGGDEGGPGGGPDLGGGPDMGDEGGPGGEGDEADLAAALGEPAGKDTGLTESEDVKEGHGEHAEDYERPSQKGVKNARRDFRFGEDPRGTLEMNSALKLEIEKQKKLKSLRNKTSPLNLENVLPKSAKFVMNQQIIKSLDTHLSGKRAVKEKKELIKETENTPSLMDESNIIDE